MHFLIFPNRRVLIAGACGSSARALIESPLELAKVRSNKGHDRAVTGQSKVMLEWSNVDKDQLICLINSIHGEAILELKQDLVGWALTPVLLINPSMLRDWQIRPASQAVWNGCSADRARNLKGGIGSLFDLC